MSDRLLLATFAHEEDLLDATQAVRNAGYSIVDIYTPFAVHGLDAAMGLRPSRLTWICFICGAIGALGMFGFEQWTAAIDWAIDVGGKPWNSWPSDIPVAFEAMVFLAATGSVLAFLGVSGMYPGKRPQLFDNRTTDDRFILVIDEHNAAFSLAGIQLLLDRYGVLSIEERLANGEDMP